MKKLLSRTIPLILILLAIPLSASAYFFKVDGIYYIKIGGSANTVAVTYKDSNYNSYSGSVTIPSQVAYSGTTYTVTAIEYKAFYKCKDLTSVTIPNSVTTIGESAFEGCTGLTSVTIPNSVTNIGSDAFYNCTGLTSVTIGNSVSSIGDHAFRYCSGLTSVTIPNSVTSIGDCAFYDCSGLTSVTIPNSVTSIGDCAFEFCSSLTSVTIPKSVTSIGDHAFSYCSGLEEIIVDNGNTVYDSRDNCNAIIKTNTNTLITGCKNTIIPNSVTSIGEYAFWCCSGLTSVTIPNSVTSIGSSAFCGCSGLTSVTIPNSVTSIGSYAFESCSSLTSVTIPKSVTSIGEYAFRYCSGLTSVVVPNSVTSISFSVFYNCNNAKIKAFPQPYSRLKGDWGSDCGKLVLVGGRLYDYSSIGIHQESIDFVIEALDYEPAPKGYESVEACEGGIYYNNKYYQINSGETLTINNLYPNREYTFQCYTKYSNGPTIFDERKITTNSLGVNVTNDYTATTVSAMCTYQMDDAVFDREYITFNGETIEGHKLFVTGLKPNTSYEESYTVCTKGGSKETKKFNFTTPALELTILKPNGVSSTCTIVAAETNMSDDEISAGFQWKKNDAPSTLEPNEAFAAIYDGRLEGYIKNLQSTSYYDVRAFYKAADGTYYYSDWKSFDPSDFSYFEPTVHTYPTSEVTTNSATVKGYVLPGSDEITSQGIEYWENDNATAAKKVLSATADDNGVNTIFANGQVMLVTLSDLQQATTYSYRAFVTTQAGVTYGEEQSFTTKGEAGIGSVGVDSPERVVIGYFDLSGRRYEEPQRGLNIVVYSDGSTEKVIVKQ
ncbi:MAG: leucine-rich repeat domain-containing protein [Muribaculaceae bacterium]